MTETIQHEDGRVELTPSALDKVEHSPLYNDDLAPVPVSRRNWTTYNYAALWISMAHCIPTYMLASGLIGAGMNWWQALITILLGNTIVLAADPAQLASRHEVRHPVPGLRARAATARSARTCRRSCAPSSRAAGSASRRGSAARRCTHSSAPSSPAGILRSDIPSAATRRRVDLVPRSSGASTS